MEKEDISLKADEDMLQDESIKGSVSEHGTDDGETERYQNIKRSNICEKS